MPAPHPAEFRRRAVELARERTKPIAELAKDLRISDVNAARILTPLLSPVEK